MKKLCSVCLVIFGLFLSQASYAEYVVDTGEPTVGYNYYWLIVPGWDANVAAKFTLTAATCITSIKGAVRFDTPGQLYVAIHDGGCGNTVPGELLFTGEASYTGGLWTGPSGLNHCLQPGTYWVRFFTDELAAYMGSSVGGSLPNPLPIESYSDQQQPSCTWWNETLRLAVRIEGVPPIAVTTNSITATTATTATGGGNVASEGSTTVTARGVCWAISANPTTSDSCTTDGTGAGPFTSSITGLGANTQYHVRAYATNSSGTSYGYDVPFTTKEEMFLVIPSRKGGGAVVYLE